MLVVQLRLSSADQNRYWRISCWSCAGYLIRLHLSDILYLMCRLFQLIGFKLFLSVRTELVDYIVASIIGQQFVIRPKHFAS